MKALYLKIPCCGVCAAKGRPARKIAWLFGAVGAAVGICCLCRKKGKKANIVIDLENNASKRLIEEVCAVPEYRDVFISGQDALLTADNRSILIVVDTNRPDQVECKPLLEAIPKVCVVDHHRRAADYINPVVVNLHEPYASSASELVTEILLYAVEKKDVLDVEAKALMAGICLDTKFFNVRTGERTFEAAAFLRRAGADTSDVQKLFQNNLQDMVTRYDVIRRAELYHGDVALAAVAEDGVDRVAAAQAADELLNLKGVRASFVIYRNGNVQKQNRGQQYRAAFEEVLSKLQGMSVDAETGLRTVLGNKVKKFINIPR